MTKPTPTPLDALLERGSGATVTEFYRAANVSRSTAYKWLSTLGIQTQNGTIAHEDLADLATLARGESTPADLARAKGAKAQAENLSTAMGTDTAQTQTAMMGAIGQQVIEAGMLMGQQLAPLFWQGVEAGLVTGQATSAHGFLAHLSQQSQGVASNVEAMVQAFTARSQGNVMSILSGVEPLALPPTPTQKSLYADNL